MNITKENCFDTLYCNVINVLVMLPIVHFLISIGIGFALEIKSPRKNLNILLFGIIGTLPDLDHFLPQLGSTGIFHSTLMLGVLPLAFFMAAHMLETHFNEASSKYQRFFIGVIIVLSSHLILDLIAGRSIAYSFAETGIFSLSSTPLLEIGGLGVIIQSTDLLWLFLGIMVLVGNLTQKKIYAFIEEYYAEEELAFEKQYPSNALLSRRLISGKFS